MKDSLHHQIDDYLSGRLSSEERAAFEALMLEDQQFAQAVKAQQAQLYNPVRKILPLFRNPLLLGVAATLLILVLLRLFFIPPFQDPRQVYRQFADGYPNDLIRLDVQTDCLPVRDAFKAYQQQQYAQAAQLLKALLKEKPLLKACHVSRADIQLLLGISYLESDAIGLAREQLKPLSDEMETAHWYYILSFVKVGAWKQARIQLQNWSNPSAHYQKRMDELLKKLQDQT